jgi:hypothetical protein
MLRKEVSTCLPCVGASSEPEATVCKSSACGFGCCVEGLLPFDVHSVNSIIIDLSNFSKAAKLVDE